MAGHRIRGHGWTVSLPQPLAWAMSGSDWPEAVMFSHVHLHMRLHGWRWPGDLSVLPVKQVGRQRPDPFVQGSFSEV